MKITRIVEQEKQKGRYSVFVDGVYAFSLSEAALLEGKLAPKQELTLEELQEWKRQSADDKAYGNALRYAAGRPHSRWEMEQYLQRKGISPALADLILNKLSNIGLLDDAAFARSWVANRHLLRPTSKRKLQQELRAKRIADEVITQTLAEATGDEHAALRELIAKKRLLPKFRNDNLKLMQSLARQGIGYDDIKQELEDR